MDYNYSSVELLEKIQECKNILKTNNVFKSLCSDFKIDCDIIDLIPVRFGNIDVSAKTIRGIVILNFKLLNNLKKNIHYLLHELCHVIQMLERDRPTKGADDGEYLENEDEIEAFTYQIEHMGDNFGEEEADKYIEHLLDHHEIDEDEKEDKRKELSERL